MKSPAGIFRLFVLTLFASLAIGVFEGISETTTITAPGISSFLSDGNHSGAEEIHSFTDTEAVHFSSLKTPTGGSQAVYHPEHFFSTKFLLLVVGLLSGKPAPGGDFEFHPLALKIIFPHHYFW